MRSRLVAHAGLGVLGEFCDAVGLGEILSKQLPYQGPGVAVFDWSAVLAQMMLMGITPDVEGGLTLDIDAFVHEVHSENKQGATAGAKTCGYHPMYCVANIIGEVLSSILKPGKKDAVGNLAQRHFG